MVHRSSPVNLSKGSTREEIVQCGNVVQMSYEPSEAETLEKKRKRDGDDEEKWTSPPQNNTKSIRNTHNVLTDKSKDSAKKGEEILDFKFYLISFHF